jgi:alpha-L-rhamnosidase
MISPHFNHKNLPRALTMRLALPLLAAAALAAAQESTRLRTEYLEHPLGLDVVSPRFSWAPIHPMRGQSMVSYNLAVKTAAGTPVWSIGPVASNVSTNVAYTGPALTSDTDYVWTVTWTDGSGAQSPVASAPFSTGLYANSDWQGAIYVGGSPAGNDMLRAEFTVPVTPTRARLYISGLGYYKSWLNGVMTDNHELGQFTTFEKRVLYDAWDVSELVHEGW